MIKKIKVFILLFILISCTKNSSNQVLYPDNKPIDVIVAYKKGGGTDTGARLICEIAQTYLNTKINVINIVAKDAEMGYTKLANAKADGYTLGFINIPTFISLQYDRNTIYQSDDFIPIFNHVFDPAVLVVRNNSPFSNLKDFIKKAKNKVFRIGNNGFASSNHIGAALLESKLSIKFEHVPYSGTTDMLNALNNNEVDLVVAKISEVADKVKNNEYKLLVSFTNTRLSEFNQIPTLKELGFDLVLGSYRALVAPKNVNKEVIKILEQAFYQAFYDANHIKASKLQNLNIFYMSSDNLQKHIKLQDEYVKNLMNNLHL